MGAEPVIDLPRQRGDVTVRLGGLDDDLDAVNVGNEMWWGQHFLADRVRSSPPDDPWLIMLGEVDDQPVGYAFVLGRGVQAGGYAMGDLYVLPRGRRRGVGRALVGALTDATLAYGLPGIMVGAPAGDAESLAVAEHWGFEVVGRHRESVLDLDALDTETSAAPVRRATEQGYRLSHLQGGTDETMWRRIYDLAMLLWRDAPDGKGSTDVMPYPVFRGFFPDPSYVLVAWRGDEPMGFTAVIDRAKDDALNTWFTGVRREVRGRGLSVALKAQHALLMRERGHRRLYTQNMEGNAPILAANDRLGFRPHSSFVDLALAVSGR